MFYYLAHDVCYIGWKTELHFETNYLGRHHGNSPPENPWSYQSREALSTRSCKILWQICQPYQQTGSTPDAFRQSAVL